MTPEQRQSAYKLEVAQRQANWFGGYFRRLLDKRLKVKP
jgi:hypothetical protein